MNTLSGGGCAEKAGDKKPFAKKAPAKKSGDKAEKKEAPAAKISTKFGEERME